MVGQIYWRHRRTANTLLALTVSLVAATGHRFGLPATFDLSLATFLRACELALTVATSLLGFLIAAIALVFAMLEASRLALLRKSASFNELVRLSRAAVFWLIICAVLGAIGVLLTPAAIESAYSGGFRACLAFAAVQAFATTAGLSWVLGRLIGIG